MSVPVTSISSGPGSSTCACVNSIHLVSSLMPPLPSLRIVSLNDFESLQEPGYFVSLLLCTPPTAVPMVLSIRIRRTASRASKESRIMIYMMPVSSQNEVSMQLEGSSFASDFAS